MLEKLWYEFIMFAPTQNKCLIVHMEMFVFLSQPLSQDPMPTNFAQTLLHIK